MTAAHEEPMADIAKKLREEAAILPHEVYTFLNPILTEAAAEIERQNTLLTNGALSEIGRLSRLLTAANSEIDRLRTSQTMTAQPESTDSTLS